MFSSLINNLPALLIVVPMFAAPLIALMPANNMWRWGAWSVSFMVSSFVFVASFYLFVKVDDQGAQGYIMGNWPPPIGVQYMATQLNTFVLLVLSAVNFIIFPFAYVSAEREISRPRLPLFYATLMLALSGLFGMVISNDIFNIYVFLEISSLATYALMSLGRGKQALTSSFSYLIAGTAGATFFLLGIAFIYAATGTLNITDLAIILDNQGNSKLTITALSLMIIGLMVKAAVFPLGFWLPGAYKNSPSFVTAFIAAGATKIALFLLFRVIYEIFPPVTGVQTILASLAAVGIVYGSFKAVKETDAKSILAYSSIANVSYILLGFATGSAVGLVAAFFHYLAHAIAKGGMFTALGMMSLETGSTKLENLKGIAHKQPMVAGCFTLLGASLVGLPLTAGFITKWNLFTAVMHQPEWLQVISILAIIIGSLLSAVYIWKITEALYYGHKASKAAKPDFSVSPLITLSVITIICGAYATPLINFLNAAVSHILSGGINV